MEPQSGLSTYELKDMKLSDLKEILHKLGLKKSGNKEELQMRITNHLNTPQGRLEAQNKLDKHFVERFYYCSLPPESQADIKCICENGSGPVITCTKCGKHQHKACVGANVFMSPYECSWCQILQMDPLDKPIRFLIEPFMLERNQSHHSETQRSFLFTEQHRNEVLEAEGRYQVQVRCLKPNETGFIHFWPKIGSLKINKTVAIEFRQPENPNSKKRKDAPLNITTLLSLGLNTITLIKHNDSDSFIVAVVLIDMRPEVEVVKELRQEKKLNLESAKMFVLKKMNEGHDDIISESIKVSLKCPITMTLITIPVRGINCKHIACFNLETFVNMQRKSKINKWRCPYCQELAIHVVLDMFFQDILEKASLLPYANQVEIYNNGSYKIIEFKDMDDLNEESKSSDRKRQRENSDEDDIPRKQFNAESRTLENLLTSALENANSRPSSNINLATPQPEPRREESKIQEVRNSDTLNLPLAQPQQVDGTSQCPICID